MSSLTLYVDSNYVSPYAMSAYVALNEKQLEFEMKTVNLDRQENYHHLFANASLTSRVPTLVHDSFSLSESSAIDEYIDETFTGTRLYPVDIKQRARARQIQAWLRSDLMPIRNERSTQVVFNKPVAMPLSIGAKKTAEKLFFVVEQLLPQDAKNLFGEWSIADVDLSLMLQRLICNDDPVPTRLADYAKYQWQRDTVQQWVALKRP